MEPVTRFVIAKRPFSPTVHLGKLDASQGKVEPAKVVSDQTAAETGSKAKTKITSYKNQQAYVKVPVTLKDKLPLDHQFQFKPQKKVVSVEKEKKRREKRLKEKASKSKPHQISYTIDKEKSARLEEQRERERALKAQKKEPSKVVVTEHAVQTDSTLTQAQQAKKSKLGPSPSTHKRPPLSSSKEAQEKPADRPVHVPFPRPGQTEKKRLSSNEKDFLSKGGITVYKPRSHRPQPFFKSAAAHKKPVGQVGDQDQRDKSPLAPKRFPIEPKLALQEIAKEKELEAKRASDEQKRKHAVAGLLKRVKQDIQKQHERRAIELESKVHESSKKLTSVSALLQKSNPRTSGAARVLAPGSDKGGTDRTPLTPANMNKPSTASETVRAKHKLQGSGARPGAKTEKGNENSSRKIQNEGMSKKSLQELLDETPESAAADAKRKYAERDYPKPWQTYMKKPVKKPSQDSSDSKSPGVAEGKDKENQEEASARKSTSAGTLPDIYSILDEPEVQVEGDEKRKEILRFMKRKRLEVAKAERELNEKELEKRYLMRNVHKEYAEHSKLKARDLVANHKDLIV